MNVEKGFSITSQEKERQDLRLFMIVKPDGGRYLAELEQTLNERQTFITDVYTIQDWERVARSIYKKQLQNSSRSFCVGFESHVWLCQYLFGNHGLLLLLDTEAKNLSFNSQTQAVHEARDSFRSKFSASNDIFAMAVNLDRLSGWSFRGSGKKKGYLGISQPNSFDPLFDEEKSKGRWFNNYFKYIHAPQNSEELSYQFQALVELGIFRKENEIDIEEWEMLKYMHCLVPPSKYIKPNIIG